ncbi:STAS domain-containing protein [Streptomyces sp. TRM66268-LWL]|uniref:STAS domain-containing protein n=1 Tax=Streptomyces polyasparticus TaxID=2767826 RepID=A0ABR7SIH6_9ACTN|nr:STAS domain-containing protein [Streptomyces polyasparticus]MBC9714764.1 STAS domain-containing protein [Streptomyces polyasparticus]
MPELPGEQFRIDLVAGVDPVLVILSGEFDLLAVPSLQETLEPLSSRRIEIDCADVRFLDSSGLGALVDQVRRSRLAGGHAAVIHVPPAMLQVLEISGCLDFLTDPPDDPAPGNM